MVNLATKSVGSYSFCTRYTLPPLSANLLLQNRDRCLVFEFRIRELASDILVAWYNKHTGISIYYTYSNVIITSLILIDPFS